MQVRVGGFLLCKFDLSYLYLDSKSMKPSKGQAIFSWIFSGMCGSGKLVYYAAVL